MADDQQQPGQPPAGEPGSWPPPPQPADPEQTTFQPQPPQQPGWGAPPQQPPAWGQPPQQPGWGAPPQPPAWGQPPQPPAWGQPPQQPPAWGQPPQQPTAWGQPQQPFGAPQFPPPPQPGFAPPFGAPGAFPPVAAYGPRYAGFWIRLLAFIIDGFILTALAILCIITIIGILALPFVIFGYFPVLWWKRGASFGQSALNLRVVRAIDGGPIDGGMAAVRAVVFWLEDFGANLLFIGLIGFIWAAFEPRKRAWHDMAAGTVVIHTL